MIPDNQPHASLGVVLKTAERCNIDCTYCYMFNMGDDSYKKRPPLISLDTIEAISRFLEQGIADLKLNALTIEFHGGEPLMQKKRDFAATCDIFKARLGSIVNLDFIMQTNAMLVDDEWIDLLCKYRVGVGVSIDGTRELHNQSRIDHRRRGTYDRVVEKIKLLQNSPDVMKLGGIGSLCVINPAHNPRQIYRHFVDDLHIRSMDFLLPYHTHEHRLPHSVKKYGEYLCQLFDEWSAGDDPDIHVRILKSTLDLFAGGFSHIYGVGPMKKNQLPLISIATNGDLSPSDEFRATDPVMIHSGANVKTISLINYLQEPIFKEIEIAQNILPQECQSCCWQKVCGGGGIVNRFKKSNKFNNPSIYCEGLKDFYSEVATYMIKNGYPAKKLLGQLELDGGLAL